MLSTMRLSMQFTPSTKATKFTLGPVLIAFNLSTLHESWRPFLAQTASQSSGPSPRYQLVLAGVGKAVVGLIVGDEVGAGVVSKSIVNLAIPFAPPYPCTYTLYSWKRSVNTVTSLHQLPLEKLSSTKLRH